MSAIRNYSNTLIELRSCEQRYRFLREKREVYYVKYLGAKSPVYGKVGGSTNWTPDNMSIFLDLISRKNEKTGMSLDEEMEVLSGEMSEYNRLLREMAKSLKMMRGIEYELYTEIVINGLTVSNAVKRIAEKNFMSENNVWVQYYPRIKDEIKKLERNDKV